MTASITPERWFTRLGLAAVAFAGTAFYAGSFQFLGGRESLGTAGVAIGIAAGVSWLIFGALLLLLTAGRPSALDWADACLRTMAAGIVVLVLAALFNGGVALSNTRPPAALLAAIHLVLLLIGNLLMCGVFYRNARRLGLSPRKAIAAWMLGLNGAFMLILLSLYRSGAMQP